jgi:hypothetical protein
MLISNRFHTYADAIRTLPLGRPLSKDELLVQRFLLHKEGKISVYYAPHNEYINTRARIMIVGITPGWTQMELAFRKARVYLEQGLPAVEICKRIKADAGFAGSMRANLVDMLDRLELHRYAGVASCGDLFTGAGEHLHTTSMLKYPVFVAGRNYTGHSPALLSNSFLRDEAEHFLTQEVRQLAQPLIIPLGKTVEAMLHFLVEQRVVEGWQVLWGFPHPSGANGHRHKQFNQAIDEMQTMLAGFDHRFG